MDIDKKLVQNTELTFLKENLTKTLLLNDDGIVELYEEGKLIDSKPFSKINVERDYKKIIQEGYTLVEDKEEVIKYNVYLLLGEDGVYNSKLICTVDSEEQAQDRVTELEAENGCGAYYEKVDENGKVLEEDNQNIQQDLDQTEQELKDDIEQVDRAQELKDELETKLDKLYNENKDIKTDLGIEPGSDEEAKLDDLLDTDYDLVWDDLDEDEKEQYSKVVSTIRRLKPDEALIDVIDEINNKAKENKLKKDILLYSYLKNNKKTENNEYVMTPIPDELKQQDEPKGWTEEMWQDYYLKMNNTVREAYKLDGDNSNYIKDKMSRYNINLELNKQNLKDIADKIAEGYANEKKETYLKRNNLIEEKEIDIIMPTGPHTSKKLSKQEILDMNQIPVSEKQVKYLTNLGITEEDIIVGLQDLVKQMKYLDDNKPFISIEEYVNEVTKF